MIPYGKQNINQSDIDSVIAVLKSDFLTQGPQVPLFEKKISSYCKSLHAVAVNSATSALHIACLALGLKKGDWLWTSPNSFVASANCGLYCDASVDFVDIDPLTYNMSVPELEKKLIKAKKKEKLPKIIVPVHFAGQSCDMKEIHKLSKEFGFRVIEDASHAIGGKYMGQPVGNCRYSDITVFSFHPVKIITTAEGGLATTNSNELAEKMQSLRSHGITRNKHHMKGEVEGGWFYQQVDLGFNYRMTEISAALGISQMLRLSEFIEYRHKLKERYDSLLKKLPLIRPFQDNKNYSSMHLYPIQIDFKKLNITREFFYDNLKKRGIGVNIHYIPIHTHPYYQNMGFIKGDYPNSETLYSRSISIPLHQSMTFKQQDKVINSLEELLLDQ